MPTAFLEIIELPDGRLMLRRAGDEMVLVTLEFSEQARQFLQGQHIEVAKAMFDTGVQLAGQIAEGEVLDGLPESDAEYGARILH